MELGEAAKAKQNIFWKLGELPGKDPRFALISGERMQEIYNLPHTVTPEEMNTLNVFMKIFKMRKNNMIEDVLASGKLSEKEMYNRFTEEIPETTKKVFKKYGDVLSDPKGLKQQMEIWDRMAKIPNCRKEVLEKMVHVIMPRENSRFEPIESSIGMDVWLQSLKAYERKRKEGNAKKKVNVVRRRVVRPA